MSAEIPHPNPEINEVAEDNAFKYTLGGISEALLREHGATSFLLTTHWLEMSEASERKLAHKKFENGNDIFLLIQKIRHGGRTTVPPKETLSPEKYQSLLAEHKPQTSVTKVRYEFDYEQRGNRFKIKYDKFVGSELRVLEVDADSDEQRELFDQSEFAKEFDTALTNVTGQQEYYGYRIAALIAK